MPRKYYYVVRKGYKPGVYESWAAAKEQVSGYPNAEYKKFATVAEADHYMSTGSVMETKTIMLQKAAKEKPPPPKPRTPLPVRPPPREHAKAKYAPPAAAPPLESVRVPPPSQPRVTAVPKAKEVHESARLEVWTDGSSYRNGYPDCQAGYGVFFSQGNPLNLSKPMVGILGEKETPSNQKAELKAIEAALGVVDKHFRIGVEEVVVYSDSQYSINCVTKWIRQWQRNGWQTTSGKDVKNKTIIKGIWTAMEDLKQRGIAVKFKHLNSHTKPPKDKTSKDYRLWFGNHMADKLATEGTKLAKHLSAASCNVKILPTGVNFKKQMSG